MTWHQNRRSLAIDGGAIAAIAAAAFLYNLWLLDARTYFYADDWQWLWRAEFMPWSDPLDLMLPVWAYNDRPLGAAFIKGLYTAFGLNHHAFQIVLLALHAVNCVLLYAIAARFTGRLGALVAALLAAIWFFANGAAGWTAAIFDLLGATLCLATVALRQVSVRSGNDVRVDIAAAICYLMAIRTKEFALGLIVVLLVMNILVERQSFRATLRQLWPYLLVFLVYAARYAQLLNTNHPPSGTPYHLEFAPPLVAQTLAFYVSNLFWADSAMQPMFVAGLVLALGLAILLANERAQRIALWSLSAFVILLGPVLLLPTHPDALYLYTPHFFVALAIGVLPARRPASIALVAILLAGILSQSFWSPLRRNAIAWHLTTDEANQAMLASAMKALAPVPPGATVFIAGVPPVRNPFWLHPGNALNIAFKDVTLAVETERPEAELAAKFCRTSGHRRFLRFEGTRATDVTAEVSGRCAT